MVFVNKKSPGIANESIAEDFNDSFIAIEHFLLHSLNW